MVDEIFKKSIRCVDTLSDDRTHEHAYKMGTEGILPLFQTVMIMVPVLQ